MSTLNIPRFSASPDELHQALMLGEFRTHLQPKFELKTGKVTSAEVLARWQHPQHGLLLPDCFIDALRACGLLNELLFQQLCECLKLQVCTHSRQGMHLHLSYNVLSYCQIWCMSRSGGIPI